MVRSKPTWIAIGTVSATMVLSLWGVGGCTLAKKARPKPLAQWERQMNLLGPDSGARESSSRPIRSLAESPAHKCLKDRLDRQDIASVVNSVTRLQAEKKGPRVQGTW